MFSERLCSGFGIQSKKATWQTTLKKEGRAESFCAFCTVFKLATDDKLGSEQKQQNWPTTSCII